MKIQSETRIALTAAAMVALAACGTDEFTNQKAQPLIDLKLAEDASSTVVATTAERRLVLYRQGPEITMPTLTGTPPAVTRRTTESGVQFCAEPSPDAIESLASLFSAAGSFGSSSPTGPTVEASANFSNALTTAVSSAFNRSQGIQFFRDGVFALCQAAMNGWVETAKEGKQFFVADVVRFEPGSEPLKDEKGKVVKDANDDPRMIPRRIKETLAAETIDGLNEIIAGYRKEVTNPDLPKPEVTSIRARSEFETALRFLRDASKDIIIKEAETGALLNVTGNNSSLDEQIKAQTARLAAVQKFQQQLNPNKPAPAVVNVTLEGDFDGEVIVFVDGEKNLTATAKSFVISDLSPGLRKIKLTAVRGGKPVSREVAEDLKSGLQAKTYTLVFELKAS